MSKPSPLTKHLPWVWFEAPGVVLNKDGGFQRTYAFQGLDVSAVPLTERVMQSERLNRILYGHTGRWVWHVEGQNVPVTNYPQSEWPTSTSRLLDASRAAKFTTRGAQFEMRHWLTFTKSPAAAIGAKVRSALVTDADGNEHARWRDEFRRDTDEMARQLSGVLRVSELGDDETATYLQSTVSTRRHRVRAADHPILCETLGSDVFVRGFGLHRWGDCYTSVMSLGGFPRKSNPQLLADLARLPFEFRHVVRCVALDHHETKRLMKNRADTARAGVESVQGVAQQKLIGFMYGRQVADGLKATQDTEYERLGNEAEKAMADLGSYGYVSMTTTFMVWDRDKARCYEKRAALRTLLERHQLVVREEAFEPVRPWLMSLPGNRDLGRRAYPINTRSVVDMWPVTTLWHGQPHDAQLAATTGVRRPWMYTADPVPFSVNTDVPGGAAHCVVFGQTGKAGKSTIANHLGLQFLGWPGAKVVSISVGRSELGPCLLSGGAVYRVGDPKSPLRFQPLASIDTPDGALEASEWLQLCLREQGLTPTPDDAEKLGDAIRLHASDVPARRTMTEMVRDLSSRAPHLAQALKPYTDAGDYGFIFDGNDGAALQQKRWTMFDIQALLKRSTKAIVPAVAHMLNLIDGWIDGTPMLFLGDECPDWLPHAPLQRYVIRLLDTQRKNNVRALLIAQTPAQLLEMPRLMTSIQSGCATTIFAPEGKAMQFRDAYAKFGVNEVECESISKAPLGDYMLKNEYGTRTFSLKADAIALALTSLNKPNELALLERLHTECEGDADRMLHALLRERGLAEAAGKLTGWKTEDCAQTAA